MRSLLLSQVYLGRVAKRHAECIRNETNTKIIFYAYANTCMFFGPRIQKPDLCFIYGFRAGILKSLRGLGTEEEWVIVPARQAT